jgi:hypothetical protein
VPTRQSLKAQNSDTSQSERNLNVLCVSAVVLVSSDVLNPFAFSCLARFKQAGFIVASLRVKVRAPHTQQRNQGGAVAYRDLRDFLRKLEKNDELRRISVEVDPVLEITEISDRAVKAAGPALLFERPKGSRVPAVTNLVGTERRMCLALEVDSLEDVAARVHSFIDMQSPQGLFEKVKMLPKLAEIGSFFE